MCISYGSIYGSIYFRIVFALRDQLDSTSGSGAEELQAQKALKLFSLIASSRRVTLLGVTMFWMENLEKSQLGVNDLGKL